MKIAVAGIGYVGLSNAILLSQHSEVVAYDLDQDRVNLVNSKKSPIIDKEVSDFLANKPLDLIATNDIHEAFYVADFIIIATPTNYDEDTNCFDTSSVEAVINIAAQQYPTATIVIKSTIPVGYTERIKTQFNHPNIIFSPEFLREGKALLDNLYPSRIIVGEVSNRAQLFADLMQQGAIKKDIPLLLTNNTEAEAIKLFQILI